jgi:hypothetical protein
VASPEACSGYSVTLAALKLAAYRPLGPLQTVDVGLAVAIAVPVRVLPGVAVAVFVAAVPVVAVAVLVGVRLGAGVAVFVGTFLDKFVALLVSVGGFPAAVAPSMPAPWLAVRQSSATSASDMYALCCIGIPPRRQTPCDTYEPVR